MGVISCADANSAPDGRKVRVAGVVLVRLFENPALVERRRLAFAAWGNFPG